MKNNIFSLSLDELNQFFLEELYKENILNKDYAYWQDFFGSVLVGFATTRYDLNPYHLYRTRINFDSKTKRKIDSFYNVNELWSPNPNNVCKLGRCNTIRESILYCSTQPNTNLFEIEPIDDHEITTIEYRTIDSIKNLIVLGVSDLSNIDIYLKQILKDHFKYNNTSSDYINKIVMADNMLSNIFKKRIDYKNEYFYNLTVGITKFLLSEKKFQSLISQPSNGLIFPSVATVLGGINFALKPEYAKTVLKPSNVYKYKILQKVDTHHYIVQMTHSSSVFSVDGKIEWKKESREQEYITDLPIN